MHLYSAKSRLFTLIVVLAGSSGELGLQPPLGSNGAARLGHPGQTWVLTFNSTHLQQEGSVSEHFTFTRMVSVSPTRSETDMHDQPLLSHKCTACFKKREI